MENHVIKIAVSGWYGNPSRAAEMLEKYKCPGVEFTFIGVLKPFTSGYDVILNFGSRPKMMLYLLTCRGRKIVRICGTDWYRAQIGQRLHRIMLCVLGFEIMYADETLKQQVGLSGEVYMMPVNEDHFYPRIGVPRDKEVCYYILKNRDIYMPELMPEGATLIDGTTPYEDMPILLSRHKKYVRFTKHDAAPKLPYEALLCGCEVWVNGEQIKEVSEDMTTRYQAPKWVRYLTAENTG